MKKTGHSIGFKNENRHENEYRNKEGQILNQEVCGGCNISWRHEERHCKCTYRGTKLELINDFHGNFGIQPDKL